MDENYRTELSRHYLDRLILKLHQYHTQIQVDREEQQPQHLIGQLKRFLSEKEIQLAQRKKERQKLRKEVGEAQPCCVEAAEPILLRPQQQQISFEKVNEVTRQSQKLSQLCSEIECLKSKRSSLCMEIDFYQNIKQQLIEDRSRKISLVDETDKKNDLKQKLNEIFREMAQLSEQTVKNDSRKVNSIRLSMDRIDSELVSPKKQQKLEVWKWIVVAVILMFLLKQISQY